MGACPPVVYCKTYILRSNSTFPMWTKPLRAHPYTNKNVTHYYNVYTEALRSCYTRRTSTPYRLSSITGTEATPVMQCVPAMLNPLHIRITHRHVMCNG